MAGFYHLYLPSILQMRSGDIETNPGPNTPESTVSEEELILLSECIDPAKYKRLGNRLGMSYAVLKQIKRQSHDNYSDAFMEVFTKWRNEQLPGTNTRAILAEELQTCGLGELSGKLLLGSLVPSNIKSKSSVPAPSPPSPPRQPLSPELIRKCAEDFKRKYRYTLCKIRADPLNPDSLVKFKSMYTNLVLEKEDETNTEKTKRLLDYSDLVNNLKDEEKITRRLLVQGEAGAGKTTFCAKIAWDWINGIHFQEFEWVIIVPLREAKKYTIGEIAKSYLTSNNPTTASQLTEYMHLNTDKVFIVFDGLDEFGEDGSQTSGLQSSQSQGQSSNPSGSTQYQVELRSASGEKKTSAEMEIRIGEILRSEKLETVPVMVTTRPWKAVEIRRNDRLRKNYTFLYVEGFNKKNVASYIRKYFIGDRAEAESLIQFVNDNDVISENVAPYPIYIAMLCLMWRDFDKEKQKTIKALQTFSQIFEKIFVFLKGHYALKITNPSCSLDESLNYCLKDVNQLLQPIASIALNGLMRNTLVFKEGDFEHCQDSMKTACRVGVLSEESKINLGKGRCDASNLAVFFPCKFFQEFMAGLHLASLYETDTREYNRLMETVTGHRKKEFRHLLYFTASKNQRVGDDVLTYIGRSAEEAADKHFLVDVAFECHDTQAAAVVKDKVLPENATLEVDDSMTAHTVAGYAFIKTDMASLTVERDCGPTMSCEVAEMICSLPSLRKVALHRQLHDNFFTTIAAQGQFSKIQSLTIRFAGKVSPSVSHDLAVALGSMPDLTELKLDGVKDLHDEFISTLKAVAASMKDCFPQITKGNFHFNGTPHDSLESFLHQLSGTNRQKVGENPLDYYMYQQSSPMYLHHGLSDPDVLHLPASPDGDSSVYYSTAEGLTPIITYPTATLQSQQIITKESSSGQEAGNQDGGSDDKGSRDLQDTSLYPSESQEYFKLPSLPAQVGDKPESPQPTHSIPSSLIQVPQSTAVLHHSRTQPLPHQGSDSSTSMPTSTHHLSQTDDKILSLPTTDTSHSEDSILDMACTREYVDSGGKVLSIPLYGFILYIPPGALEEGVWITCKALPLLPDNLELNSDELIVSPGYQCFPSGLHFKKPVKLVIPHCGVFNDPSRVRTVLIPTDSEETGEFLRTPLTQDVFKVDHHHFELSLQHFSGGHVIVLRDVLAVKGKHMLCMLYQPKIMPATRKPILELCLRNKPHNPALMETRRTDISQHVKDVEDEIFVKYRDLEVKCQLDEDEPIRTVSPGVLFSKPKHQEYFTLNLNGKADDTSVKLQLLQDTEKIQEILFRTRFPGAFSAGDPAEQSQSSRSRKREAPWSSVTDISGIPEKQMQLSRISSDHYQTSIPTPGVSSSAVEPSTETFKPSREVSEREYLELSSEIGTKGFHLIGINLGVSYAKCEAVLAEKGKDYTNALMDIFMTWNIQQQQERTDIREVLAVKLEESKLDMLAGKLRGGCLV